MLVVPLFWCETAVYYVNSVDDVNFVCFRRPQASIFHVKQNRLHQIQTFILVWLDLSQKVYERKCTSCENYCKGAHCEAVQFKLKAHQWLQRLDWLCMCMCIFFSRFQIKTDQSSFEFLKLWLRKINVLLKFTIITPECDENISNPEYINPSSLFLNANSLLSSKF